MKIFEFAPEDDTITNKTARPITANPLIWRDPTKIPPPQWLYGKHYVRGYVSATIAPGGLGKSSLDLAEAVSMAIGRDLLGRTVERAIAR